MVRSFTATICILAQLGAPGSVRADNELHCATFGANHVNGCGPQHSSDAFERGNRDSLREADQRQARGGEQKERADDYQKMGDQIGRDWDQLQPQVAQAQQSDRQASPSGSASRLQQLFSNPYRPATTERKIVEAIAATGLSTNKDLYYKGPKVRRQAYTEAEKLRDAARQTFADAEQFRGVNAQIGGFQRTTLTRQRQIASIKESGGFARSPELSRNGQPLSLASGSRQLEYEEGRRPSLRDSQISGRSGTELSAAGGTQRLHQPGGGGFSAATQASAGKGKDHPVAKTDPPPAKAPEKQGASSAATFSLLDALFDQVTKKNAQGAPASQAALEILKAARSGAQAGAPSGSEALQAIDELLPVRGPASIPEPPPVTAELAPAPPPVDQEPGSVQGSGFILSEDSLFDRIHQGHQRARQRGLISLSGS